MSHRQTLTLAEARQAIRLIGETRELGADARAWRTHFIEGVKRMVGATVGVYCECYAWHDKPHPYIPIMVDLGWRGAFERADFLRFVTGPDFPTDPEVVAAKKLFGRPFTTRRVQLVDDVTWYSSKTVNDGRRVADIDDTIHSSRPIPFDGGTDDFSVSRPWLGKQFTPRERRLVSFVHSELARVWRPRPGPASHLPPYLRKTLARLLAGRSEKEAARDLAISLHTVHSYAKEIRKTLGVSTRGEMLALCLTQATLTPRLLGPPRTAMGID